ncbi:MAG: ribonuclease P protein component [Pseudomonadota bacterium]
MSVVEPENIQTMRARAQFLACNGKARQGTEGFMLLARARGDGGTNDGLGSGAKGSGPTSGRSVNVGFTCSKKVGNAVARNRAKRRLREAARLTLPAHAQGGWDYVLIGRPETTAKLPFEKLCADLVWALARVHRHRG